MQLVGGRGGGIALNILNGRRRFFSSVITEISHLLDVNLVESQRRRRHSACVFNVLIIFARLKSTSGEAMGGRRLEF